MDYEIGASPLPPTPSPYASVFRVDVGELFGVDYVPMANDILRMVCIQIAIQLMMVLSGVGPAVFFSTGFLLLVFYTALGVMLYWLAVRKIVVFV